MRTLNIPLLRNNKGVSHAVSAIIITATTITLVLVASIYAYQTVDLQKATAEFEVATKSILAFNDSLENIAWKLRASRSARFTVSYGQLELMPSDTSRGLGLMVNVTDYPNLSYSDLTGYIRYGMQTKYVNFGENYLSYLLGNNRTISTGAGSYGRAAIAQIPGWVYITLTYGVRVMKTFTTNITQDGENVHINNVDIWIIRMNITNWSTEIGDFDLKARCLNLKTESYAGFDGNGYDVPDNRQCTITVQLGSDPIDYASVQLDDGKVVFNFVIATVHVSV